MLFLIPFATTYLYQVGFFPTFTIKIFVEKKTNFKIHVFRRGLTISQEGKQISKTLFRYTTVVWENQRRKTHLSFSFHPHGLTVKQSARFVDYFYNEMLLLRIKFKNKISGFTVSAEYYSTRPRATITQRRQGRRVQRGDDATAPHEIFTQFVASRGTVLRNY